MKPNNNFKAVFNPFTCQLAILYGNSFVQHTFEEQDEWYHVSYDGNDDQPLFLSIHLHYDESLQLLFYPRIDGIESLNENMGVYFDSNDMGNNHENITIVFNDTAFNHASVQLMNQIK